MLKRVGWGEGRLERGREEEERRNGKREIEIEKGEREREREGGRRERKGERETAMYMYILQPIKHMYMLIKGSSACMISCVQATQVGMYRIPLCLVVISPCNDI